MIRAPFCLALSLAVLLILQVPAFAQDADTPLLSNPTGVEDLSVDFDESFNAIDSEYLSDSIRLNYQIHLLEKMAERQAELLKISDSFKSLGIPFNEPAPARGLCAQLPPNGPCMKHFPELYKPLIDARQAYYEGIRQKAAMAAGIDISPKDDPAAIEKARKAKEEQERKLAELKAKAEKLERASRYQWNEVTCVAGSCTGIIVSNRTPGYRATVHKGTRLADGTLIDNIHSRGIRVVIDGDPIDLRPAPNDDDTASNAQAPQLTEVVPTSMGPAAMPGASAAVQSAIDAANASSSGGVTITDVGAQGGAAPTAAPAPAAETTAAADASGAGAGDSGTSTVQPALGPSGLF
ncbi:MAG TPA: hypothetical protein VIN59_09530 [Alphaproteobacteria bacterium]